MTRPTRGMPTLRRRFEEAAASQDVPFPRKHRQPPESPWYVWEHQHRMATDAVQRRRRAIVGMAWRGVALAIVVGVAGAVFVHGFGVY